MIKSKQRPLANKNSMFTLAVLVLCGVVITTLVQAEEYSAAPPPSYLQPQLYGAPATTPSQSQHRWLLPAKVQGRFEEGRYNVYFQDAAHESLDHGADPDQSTRMSLSVGDLRSGSAASRDRHTRALMSDWERNQYRRNGALFSMSVGRRW